MASVAAAAIARPSATNARSDASSTMPRSAASAAAATAPTKIAALVDDRFAKRNRHRVRPRIRLELREDVAHVALHGLLADEEPGGHVCVGHAVGQELEDLPLAAREHVVPLARQEGWHQCRIDVAV